MAYIKWKKQCIIIGDFLNTFLYNNAFLKAYE